MNFFLLVFALCQGLSATFQNLNFEEGQVGQVPVKWYSSGVSVATLDAKDAKEGVYCVSLERKKDVAKTTLGFLVQTINAKSYRGKHLLFRSFIRTDPQFSNTYARMWVQVFRENGKKGFFDNMPDRPIRAAKWTEYEILADVASDAETITFGLIHEGEGKVFWDDINVETLEAVENGNEAPRPLQGQGLINITAFTRLLGYLRYFYPGDEAADTNWERFAIEGIRVIESAKDQRELISYLEQWSSSVAPAIQIFPSDKTAEFKTKFTLPRQDAEKIIFWHHLGLGGSTTNLYRSWRISQNASVENKELNVPQPDHPYLADLGGGISCLIPLALYEGEKGTLPKVGVNKPTLQPQPKPKGFVPTANDRATRIADVALAWNVFQHFYPYFDVVKTDWLAVLPISLQAAATDIDEKAFLLTLQRMVAKLHDGHGGVYFIRDTQKFIPPICWDWIEGQLVITKTQGLKDQDIQVGDCVVKVDGIAVDAALTRLEESISAATPQWARWKSMRLLLLGEKNSSLSLDIRSRNGSIKTLSLIRAIESNSEEAQALQESKPDKIAILKPGLMYVDLDRVSNADFESALPDLARVQSIIFDLRGYPNKISREFLRYLSDKPLQSAHLMRPEIRFPDRQSWTFNEETRWNLRPLKPFLEAKKVFIVDGRAISQAESDLGIVEHYKLGEIVGSPTAGTNGSIDPFTLPGGYTVSWTAEKVLKHDGSRHHGIGILPTVPTSRTMQGVIDGKDELLEKAIEVATQ